MSHIVIVPPYVLAPPTQAEFVALIVPNAVYEHCARTAGRDLGDDPRPKVQAVFKIIKTMSPKAK